MDEVTDRRVQEALHGGRCVEVVIRLAPMADGRLARDVWIEAQALPEPGWLARELHRAATTLADLCEEMHEGPPAPPEVDAPDNVVPLGGSARRPR